MLSFKLKLKEDTVSADRKEQIVFDPDAWSKKDRSGKKISSITSRQNFDNEKFTRRKNKGDDELEEQIQTTGSSGYDTGTTPASNTVQPADPIKKKKTNNSQIEFVTGTAQPNGSSSTAQGNQPMTGRKLAEALIKKAMKKKSTCIDEAKYKGLEKEDKPGKVKTAAESPHPKGVNIDTVEGWKDEDIGFKHTKTTAVKEGYDPERMKDGDMMGGAGAGDISVKDKKKKKTFKEGEMKTYSEFIEQLLEYTPGPNGRTIVKGTYGSSYHDPEGDDDAWEKEGTVKLKPKAQEKRGRGRPSGSYGTYKARSAETKAAAAAKSAATKAANKNK